MQHTFNAIVLLLAAIALFVWLAYAYYIDSASRIKSGPTPAILLIVIFLLVKSYKEFKKR